MAHNTTSKPAGLYGVSVLGDDDRNTLDRALGVSTILLNVLSELPPNSATVEVSSSALNETMALVVESIEAVKESADAGWDMLREQRFMSADHVMELLGEALQPGSLSLERFLWFSEFVSEQFNGNELMRAWMQTMFERRRNVPPQRTARSRSKLATMPTAEAA